MAFDKQVLVGRWAIDFGGIEQGDAEFNGVGQAAICSSRFAIGIGHPSSQVWF